MRSHEWDVEAVRAHFVFPRTGRIVTNNAASTQPPCELLDLHRSLAPRYEKNAVMYSLMPEFRDGDNIVSTALEHNSNFVPWFAMCHHHASGYGVARINP